MRELVECESPSADLAAVARSRRRRRAGSATSRLGVAPERIVLDGRTHLRWRLGGGPTRVLVLGHHDTVWPIGSLATHPFAVEDGVLRGPGCFDMKAGLVMAFHAIAALDDRDGVTLLVTGDEELGSPTLARADRGRGARAARPRSCSRRPPTAARSRPSARASRCTRCGVVGRAAHAGLEPERGVNATVELAHQVLASPRSATRRSAPP